MTPRHSKNLRMPPQPAEPLPVHNPHAAGIDVHAAVHWVAVPPGSAPSPPADHPPNRPPHVRKVGACTADLEQRADWLAACGVTTVAMESTGVYWIPLFELLERRGFQVFLVDPRQTKQVSGRPKSDVRDCPWIQRLHRSGRRAASFRPEDQVVVLRGYLWQRLMRIRYAGPHIQHLQKALEQRNVKLAEVVSDLTGVTGLAIIQAIVRGQRDPLALAKLRNAKCKRTEAEIARALDGTWREEHLFELRQALELYQTYQAKRRACAAALERHLGTFTDQSQGQKLERKPRLRKRTSNEPPFDVRNALYRFSGVDRTRIEGIDQRTALVILGEIGRDMSKWPTAKHFTSWLGLCPQHQGSAGRSTRRRVRHGANPAARALRLAAQGCHHAKNARGALGPPPPGALRRSQGRRRDGAEERRAGLSVVEVWRSLRASGDGGGRAGLCGAAAARPGPGSERRRLPVGARRNPVAFPPRPRLGPRLAPRPRPTPHYQRPPPPWGGGRHAPG